MCTHIQIFKFIFVNLTYMLYWILLLFGIVFQFMLSWVFQPYNHSWNRFISSFLKFIFQINFFCLIILVNTHSPTSVWVVAVGILVLPLIEMSPVISHEIWCFGTFGLIELLIYEILLNYISIVLSIFIKK